MSEWRTVGNSEYRAVEPAAILHARVVSADVDAIYLRLGAKNFVVYTTQEGNPIDEYRRKEGEEMP